MGRAPAKRVAALASAATLAALPVALAALACAIPPAAPTLRHTGRLVGPGPGRVSAAVAVLLPEGGAVAPGLGLRVLAAERLELDWSAFAVVADGELRSGMGRAGGAVRIHEGRLLAAAFLFGAGAGSFDGTGFLLGADLGLAASVRPVRGLDLYAGLRLATTGYLHLDAPGAGVQWLLPAAGVRFGLPEMICGYVEWSGGLHWEIEREPSGTFLHGLTFGVEVDLGWRARPAGPDRSLPDDRSTSAPGETGPS